jgi:PTS system cellobiose-specific IIA component
LALSEQLEDIAMTIISNAGTARSASFEALEAAKNGDFAGASEKLKTAENFADASHKAHRELLDLYMKGVVEGGDILISHAQDHLMCAVLAKELIAEIIELRASAGIGKGGEV